MYGQLQRICLFIPCFLWKLFLVFLRKHPLRTVLLLVLFILLSSTNSSVIASCLETSISIKFDITIVILPKCQPMMLRKASSTMRTKCKFDVYSPALPSNVFRSLSSRDWKRQCLRGSNDSWSLLIVRVLKTYANEPHTMWVMSERRECVMKSTTCISNSANRKFNKNTVEAYVL